MDQSFYRELLESISEGIYFVDKRRTVLFWSKGAERLSGYTAQEVLGHSCADNLLRHIDGKGNHICITGCPLAATMKDGKTREATVYMHHKFGHRLPVYIRSSPMRDEQGVVIGAVEVFSDASRNLRMLGEMEELRKEVLTDPLTGIGNRRYAEVTFERLESAMRTSGGPFGVLFVDLDHFKTVNDKWGHRIGDDVLRMVAKTLEGALRPFDVICRWGGEEFVILVPNATCEQLSHTAERLRMLVQQSWIDHDGEQVRVTASFGGAVSQAGESGLDVLVRADRQTYRSKDSGRNCVCIET